MGNQYNDPNFDSDIFVVDIEGSAFFRWLVEVVKPLADNGELLLVQWSVDLGPTDHYGIIEIAMPANGADWRDLLLTIDVLALDDQNCLVELKGATGKKYAVVLDWIVRAIEAEWPTARRDRNSQRIKRDLEYNAPPPKPVSFAPPPSPVKFSQGYFELDKLNAVYKRNLKNEGGHPPLKANEWAYAELQRRPRDRASIYRQWVQKYTQEVGAEVAQLRDLREVFNSAMRYRRLREEKGDRSA